MSWKRSRLGLLAIGVALLVVASPAAAASHLARIELVPGPGGINSSFAWFIGNTDHGALFTADADTTTGAELWRSDGSLAGTKPVKDIWPGQQSSVPGPIALRLGSSLFFEANDGTHGLELWRSDGSKSGTALVRDINPTGDGLTEPQTVMGGRLYFSASDGDVSGRHGWELWSTGPGGQDT